MVEWFGDEEFESLLAFPIVKVRHQQPGNKHTKSIVAISVAKDLFSSWKHPFCFPKHFCCCADRDDLRVKLAILKSAASEVSIQKQLDVANFLSTLSSMSDQRKSAIKKNIVQLFQSSQQTSLIEKRLALHKKTNLPLKPKN